MRLLLCVLADGQQDLLVPLGVQVVSALCRTVSLAVGVLKESRIGGKTGAKRLVTAAVGRSHCILLAAVVHS